MSSKAGTITLELQLSSPSRALANSPRDEPHTLPDSLSVRTSVPFLLRSLPGACYIAHKSCLQIYLSHPREFP